MRWRNAFSWMLITSAVFGSVLSGVELSFPFDKLSGRDVSAQGEVVSESDSPSGIERWTLAVGSLLGAPAVSDGMVYVGSLDYGLHAIDADNGIEMWRYTAEENLSSTPTVVNGIVYILGSQNLYAIDAVSGVERWRFAAGGADDAFPVVMDGVIYLESLDGSGGEGGILYAVDALSGDERWRFTTEGSLRSSPAAADGTVYIGDYDGNLYAVDAVSGTERWRFSVGDYTASWPVVDNDVVYVASTDPVGATDILYAIDVNNGSEIWKFSGSTGLISSPTVMDGMVYFGGAVADPIQGYLFALDAKSGSEVWRFATGEPGDNVQTINSRPTVVDTIVYAGVSASDFLAIDSASGTELWHYGHDALGWLSPVIFDGIVYVSNGGDIYAIQPPFDRANGDLSVDNASDLESGSVSTEQAWDDYLADLDTALRTSPDLPETFTVSTRSLGSAPFPNPFPAYFVSSSQLLRFDSTLADSLNLVDVSHYATTGDASRAVDVVAGGLVQSGWTEVQVEGIEHDHLCLALGSASGAVAVCYVNRDEIVTTTMSSLTTSDVAAASTNATDLAVYVNSVLDSLPPPS